MIRVKPQIAVQEAFQSIGRPLTASELQGLGVSNIAVKRLYDAGLLERIARGIYVLPGQAEDARALWAAVALRAPSVVFCLESAAAFHGITQNLGATLHIALPYGTKHPKPALTDGVRADYYTWRENSLTSGVEHYNILGVNVPITDPARTVVDMYRYSSVSPQFGGIKKCIDTETFHDCITRYLESVGVAAASRELRKAAKQLDIWDSLKPHVELIQMTMTSMSR